MPADDALTLSAPQRGALALRRGYKILVSPFFAGSCRFVPSCADYAAEAVGRFGVLRGSALAARRLLRCHPLGGHGLDQVPGRQPGTLRTNQSCCPSSERARQEGRLALPAPQNGASGMRA